MGSALVAFILPNRNSFLVLAAAESHTSSFVKFFASEISETESGSPVHLSSSPLLTTPIGYIFPELVCMGTHYLIKWLRFIERLLCARIVLNASTWVSTLHPHQNTMN